MKQNKINDTVVSGVYQKKIKGVYLLFNSLEVKRPIVVEMWEKKMLKYIDGKRTTQEVFRKIHNMYPTLTYAQVMESIQHLASESIIKKINKADGSVKKLPERITLWISLTDQCNFRCTYCFIKKNALQMEMKGYLQAIKHIEGLIGSRHLKTVRVHYSGGEPLLNMGMLQRFHAYFLEIGKKKKIKIEETILTNGSLVSKDIVKYLAKEKISASVSLDGMKNINDKTRIDMHGGGTFSRIEKGLRTLKENNLLRNVDIVVSSRNYTQLGPLIDYLLIHQIPFVLNFYKYNFYSGNEHIPEKGSLIQELKKIYKKVYRYYVENDIKNGPLMKLQLLDLVQFGEKRIKSCGAGDTYFTIRTDGSVDKCPLITISSSARNSKFSVLTSYDVKGCAGCQWRYMCAGGCAAEKWIKHSNTGAVSEYCKVYKTLIPYLLKLEGELILHRRIRESIRENATTKSQGEDKPYRLSSC